MYCSTCGTKNERHANNCTECGSPFNMVNKLLTMKDVAEMLGVSVAYVKDHCTRQLPRIPHINLGTGNRALRRFEREQIIKFIASEALQPRGGPLR